MTRPLKRKSTHSWTSSVISFFPHIHGTLSPRPAGILLETMQPPAPRVRVARPPHRRLALHHHRSTPRWAWSFGSVAPEARGNPGNPGNPWDDGMMNRQVANSWSWRAKKRVLSIHNMWCFGNPLEPDLLYPARLTRCFSWLILDNPLQFLTHLATFHQLVQTSRQVFQQKGYPQATCWISFPKTFYGLKGLWPNYFPNQIFFSSAISLRCSMTPSWSNCLDVHLT